MQKLTSSAILVVLALTSSWALVGCGCSKDPELPPAVSKEKALEGAVERAKPFIDMLTDLKPEERQAAAQKPRVASALQAASADPTFKKKLDDLGVHL